MRIVHQLENTDMRGGGVARAVVNLCVGLAQHGHTVELLSPDASGIGPEWKVEGANPRFVAMPAPDGPMGLWRPGRLGGIVGMLSGADVVHLHGTWTTSNLQMAWAAGRAGVAYVASVHGMLDDWCMAERALKKRAFLALAGGRYFRGAAAVLCTAEAERTQAARHLAGARLEVAPLMVDIGPYVEMPEPDALAWREGFEGGAGDGVGGGVGGGGDGDGPLRVLYLSRLHYKKNTDRLIEAVGLLRDRGVWVRLVVAGTGDGAYERGLRGLVSRLGLGDRVRFYGFVDGAAKVALYRGAELYALPTSQENFGFVYFEALAAGTPVLTTRGADTWPEIESSGGGRIVADADPGRWADAIAGLAADRGALAGMGSRGRAWVMANLAPSAVIGRYEGLYREASGDA